MVWLSICVTQKNTIVYDYVRMIWLSICDRKKIDKRFLNEFFSFSLSVGTFNSEARRREATPWRTDEIWHGIWERTNAEHDESKYGRAAKRETSCFQSKQINEGCHGGYAAITEWKKWPDSRPAEADPRNCEQTSSTPTAKEKGLCSYVNKTLRLYRSWPLTAT